jgi:uncharacterized protein YegL
VTDKDYTHLAFVVDRSGSMNGIHTDMNGAITKMLADQQGQPGYCLVDITTFDTVVEQPYTNVRPDDVKGEIIVPRGGTALLDAIGVTVVTLGERFAKMDEADRPSQVIIVVVTDGMENSSREYNRQQIKALVEEQTDRWGWTFIYLAANVDAFATGSNMGFAKGSTIAFAASGVGTQSVYDSTSNLVTRTRSGLGGGYTDEEREEAMQE